MESQDHHPQDSQDNDGDVIEDNNNEVSSSPSSASTVTSGQQPTTSRVLSPDQEGLPPVPVASSSPVIKQNPAPIAIVNPVQSIVSTTTNQNINEETVGNSQRATQDTEPNLDIIEEWVRRRVDEKSSMRLQEADQKRLLAMVNFHLEGLDQLGSSSSGGVMVEETPVVASSSTAHQQQPHEAPRKEAPEEPMSPIISSSRSVKRKLQYEEKVKDQTAQDNEVGGEAQEAERPVEAEAAGNVEENDKHKAKARKKRISSTKRSGLVLSVSRINKRLKAGRYARRIGFTAGVYMAAVLEYMVAEVLELAGNCARYFKKHRIFPRCIQLTLLHDKELYQLTRGAIVPQGGVKPFIHPALTGYTGAQANAPNIIDEGDKDILQSNFG